MKFNDLKLGTIIEYFDNNETNYAVVIGISDYLDYETYFVTENAYSHIVLVAYKLVSVGLPENLTVNEDALNIRKQFINSILTVNMKEELHPNLLNKHALSLVSKVDMKPRTQEIKAWLVKNRMLNPNLFEGIFDIDDRKKRLKKIIVEREKYYNYLLNKLSCYDIMVDNNSLEKNFDKLKFGEVYLSNEYITDKSYFYICIGVQKQYFYRILRNGPIKENLSFFALKFRANEIILYCCQMSPSFMYDTGVNIMAYWWNKELYESIRDLN